ncbi:hypothetical protein ES288_D08G300000v1 [Gossypium darwinii]|uniref:Protein kinase domain-containing protein n=1 Tax=Gossypium darwinii TaxID=34276 RepID=A0A5D2BSA9_GOSDA|nr:hypothetical protein ES288_D08G300000v1 [Gossypium darwinii]
MTVNFSCFFLLSVLVLSSRVNSEPVQDKQALLAFLSKTKHPNRIQWNSSTSACDWVGVECDANRSFVFSLRLPGVGLVGSIPSNTIGRLNQLRVLSLRANRLSGEIPEDFSDLTLLRNLYLQDNAFTGEFPISVTRLARLTRLDLSSNKFAGPIPFAVNNMSHLTGLFLQNNKFSGSLPSINADGLDEFNVSNNSLNGSIPGSLSKFPKSSFAGNPALCGGPLRPCNPFFPSPEPSPIPPETPGEKSKNLSVGAIIGIAVGSTIIALLLLLFLILCLFKRRSQPPKPVTAPTGSVPPAEAGTSGGTTERERNKLVFFEGGVYSFDLEDLLRASAEVLGKGTVGTSYKALLEEGTMVVVKRLKDVAANERVFEIHMETLGKMKHENLVPLRAFYYSDDEKLLVLDFMEEGSLSALLHGSRVSGRTPPNWDSRRKIALTAARGLAHLHVTGKVVHGNIKSSNILLRPDHEACMSDFGLNPIFSNTASSSRFSGYRAPEVVETRNVTFKSDVYSFGVVLLELLTGKSPNQTSMGEEGIDLPRWVQSVVREEWTAEVFDVELMRFHNIEEEMVQLLQIAMACVSIVPDQRPIMQEVVHLIEDVYRGETDDGLPQSSDDPSKGSDGYTPPIELRTPARSVTP